jgi:KamA family protein
MNDAFIGARGFEAFAGHVGLTGAEFEERRALLAESYMPFRVTRYYADLIREQREPYRLQLLNIVLPPPGAKKFRGRFDPYGNRNARSASTSFLQHKYPRTLLLHIDDFCVANCQFCYKVNEIRVERHQPWSYRDKLAMALDYLTAHPEIDNVLLSGGDPASFRKTKDLVAIIGRLLESPRIRFVRFATKGLAYEPSRFLDPALLTFFEDVNRRTSKQVQLIVQLNHPAEISSATERALEAVRAAGVQVRGQPALVAGVNDSASTLAELQRRFLDVQIVSYYITVFMPVRGVEQYALRLHEAFGVVAASKRELGGLEKKGVLVASHDFGKLEVCGFDPTPEAPRRIILKWHQVAKPELLPASLLARVSCRPEDVLVLDYEPEATFSVDDVFRFNGLPYHDADNGLVEPELAGTPQVAP